MSFLKKFLKPLSVLHGLSLMLLSIMIISLFSALTPPAVTDWEDGVWKIIAGVGLAGGTFIAVATTAPVSVPVGTVAAILIGAGGAGAGLGVADIIDDIFDGDETTT